MTWYPLSKFTFSFHVAKNPFLLLTSNPNTHPLIHPVTGPPSPFCRHWVKCWLGCCLQEAHYRGRGGQTSLWLTLCYGIWAEIKTRTEKYNWNSIKQIEVSWGVWKGFTGVMASVLIFEGWLSVFLPGESPWTEEPGRLQSTGSQRVGYDWATKHSTAHRYCWHTWGEWPGRGTQRHRLGSMIGA